MMFSQNGKPTAR